MPTRILREGILSSERVNSLSEGAELFYRRLMSVADDYGRYYAHPSLLRAACYPFKVDRISEKQVSKWLSECTQNKLIRVYDGGKHLVIDDFRQQTRGKSKFPDPPTETTNNELLSKCTADDKHLLTDSDSGPTTSSPSTTSSPCQEPALKDLPEKLRTQRIVSKWQQWMQVRRGFKKPGNWAHLFNEQSEWLGQFTEPEAFEILSQSIRNGWQGLFPPNQQERKIHANSSTSSKQRTDGNQGTRNEGRSSDYDIKSYG